GVWHMIKRKKNRLCLLLVVSAMITIKAEKVSANGIISAFYENKEQVIRPFYELDSIFQQSLLRGTGDVELLLKSDQGESVIIEKEVLFGIRRLHLNYAEEMYILDSATCYVVAMGLLSDDRSLNNTIKKVLLDKCTVEALKQNTVTIERNLAKSRLSDRGDSLLLLPRLRFDNEKKKEVLKLFPDTAYFPRALLGNKDAERKLIEAFESEKEFDRKADLAEKLGIVGTREAVITLAEALNSRVVKENEKEEKSLRLQVLLALSRVYPENQLFRRKLLYIKNFGDVGYARLIHSKARGGRLTMKKVGILRGNTEMTGSDSLKIEGYLDDVRDFLQKETGIAIRKEYTPLIYRKKFEPHVTRKRKRIQPKMP
ncbi:MAG: hypothetical protein ACLFSB_16560, partial [Chitinispirillaceae bacterium]